MPEHDSKEVKQEETVIAFSEFLESTPPSSLANIGPLTKTRADSMGNVRRYEILAPEIQLHCPEETCNGTRFFRCTDNSLPDISQNSYNFFYMTYMCSNCQVTTKTFSLAAKREGCTNAGTCYKFGELPSYGPPTPSRLIKLIGPDRELFLMGRRCENQGLGIGAFVYYRRVVESQKNRILDEIIKVSSKLNVAADVISTLEAAKEETQFSRALASVKDAIPQALLINGHNPLSLLHSALSDGLHDQTDEHCLEVASSVRVVLAELSDRLSQALKDEAELNNALSKLMNVKSGG